MSKNLPNKPKRLRAHLEQHLHILDTLPFAILQVNKKYKVVWANLAANDLLQMDPFGLRVEDIFDVEGRLDAQPAVTNHFASAATRRSRDSTPLDCGGSWIV